MSNELNTPAVELLPSKDRFDVASRLSNRLHRSRLLIGKFWWILPLILLLILGPVYFFTAFAPARYESKARMWLAGRMNLAEGHVYNEDIQNFLGTQAELLRSPGIQNRVLAKLGVTNLPSTRPRVGTVNSGARHVQVGSAEYFQSLHDDVMESLKSLQPAQTNLESPYKLEVTESAKSSILELRAVGPEPKVTHAFLDGVMKEYLEFKKEVRSKTSDQTAASISEQVAELSKDLKAQQEKLHAFQMSNNVVFLQEQGNSAGNYLAALNRQLAVLRTEFQLLQSLKPEHWMALEKRPKEASSASADELLSSLAGPQSEVYKASQQVQLLRAKRDDLGKVLRPSHPKIIKLDEEITTQEQLARIAREESMKRIGNRRHSVELEIRNLESASKEWDVKAIDASRKIAEYDRIRQDLQRLQAAYDRLLGVMQTIDVSKVVDQENMAIMEPASPALPTKHLFRNLLIAAAVGLVVGIGLVYFSGRFDDRFTSVAELRDQLGEVIVGQIPRVSLRGPKGELRMAALERKRFEFLESFRNIRSSLLFMGNGQSRAKVILIASSIPQEGKSTVALYLAAVMAMGGARVLLVDADMRRATLHKYLGIKGKPGLAEILTGEIKPESALADTSLANLKLLPAGAARRNPGELVLSSQWSEMLRTVRSQFDYVFIDSPPLLATDDAATLAPNVDGVLFVVRGSFTRAKVAREALDMLRQRRVHMLGLILNCAVSTASEQYHYRRYKSRYRWKPEPEKPAVQLATTSVRQLAPETSEGRPTAMKG